MKYIKHIAFMGVAVLISGFAARLSAQNYPFELPKLPYAYNALEPVIDAQTMEIHYSKHHATYVKNLNLAVKGTEFEKYSLDELMLYANENGDAIRNTAGGHYNHSLYWNTLALNIPFNAQSSVGKAIISTFGSVDSLKKLLSKAGASRFGSGWAWLYVTTEKKLAVCSSPNQDNPIMDVSTERGIPILAIDVWEHAYYLKYQNKRADYLAAVLTAINWDAVNRNYTEALANPLLKTIEKDAWTELNEFHEVLGATFHPSEEGNLKPIRDRSAELLKRAKDLQNGKIPASFNTPEIKKLMVDLVSECGAINQLVYINANDKILKIRLATIHEIFHNIK
jgi:superoxide dismutase